MPIPTFTPVGPTAGTNINKPGFVSAYTPDTSDEEHRRSAWELNNPGKPYPGDTGSMRYSPGSDTYEKYVSSLSRTVTPQDEEAIREKTRAQMQASIDAVNRVYDDLLAEEKQRGLGRMGQTRSMTARGGTLTSDFGAAQMGGTEKQNVQNEKALQNERAARIQTVLDASYKLAADEIAAKRAEAQGNSVVYMNFLKEKNQKVLDMVKAYAGGGGSLEKLKMLEPDVYNTFASSFGGSDMMLQAAYNSYAEGADKRDYRYEVKNGKVVAYSINPSTRKIEVQSEAIPGLDGTVSGEYDIKTASDGRLYFIPKEIDPKKPLDQQIIKYGSGGQFSGSGTGDKAALKTGAQKVAGWLGARVGGDGYVSPTDFKAARIAFITDFPTDGADYFDNNFSNFVNPTHAQDYGIKWKQSGTQIIFPSN